MSNPQETVTQTEGQQLQQRVLSLGQAALEGRRELSDLLGDAIAELRSASLRMQQMETELEAARRSRSAAPAGGPALVSAPIGPAAAPAPPEAGVAVEADGPAAPDDLFDGPFPQRGTELEAELRTRIAGAQYLGVLRAGDRLPSIRGLARRTGLNHKVVRRLYRSLERGGLVEVRDRSGIYVPEPAASHGAELGETEAWAVRVLVEAGERGVPVPDLPGLLRGWSRTRALWCACVESTEDDRLALCSEIAERFGMETVPVAVGPGGMGGGMTAADLVVTTPYHAEEVRRALRPAQPLVVSGMHPGVRQALARSAGTGACLIVCVDPAAGARLRHGLDRDSAQRARVVVVGDAADAQRLPAGSVGVATRAAWERLGGESAPAWLSVATSVAPRAALEIAALMVRLNAESGQG